MIRTPYACTSWCCFCMLFQVVLPHLEFPDKTNQTEEKHPYHDGMTEPATEQTDLLHVLSCVAAFTIEDRCSANSFRTFLFNKTGLQTVAAVMAARMNGKLKSFRWFSFGWFF